MSCKLCTPSKLESGCIYGETLDSGYDEEIYLEYNLANGEFCLNITYDTGCAATCLTDKSGLRFCPMCGGLLTSSAWVSQMKSKKEKRMKAIADELKFLGEKELAERVEAYKF